VRVALDGAAVDGLLASSNADDGPAARAGLLVSDVIVKAEGEWIGSLASSRGIEQRESRLTAFG